LTHFSGKTIDSGLAQTVVPIYLRQSVVPRKSPRGTIKDCRSWCY